MCMPRYRIAQSYYRRHILNFPFACQMAFQRPDTNLNSHQHRSPKSMPVFDIVRFTIFANLIFIKCFIIFVFLCIFLLTRLSTLIYLLSAQGSSASELFILFSHFSLFKNSLLIYRNVLFILQNNLG